MSTKEKNPQENPEQGGLPPHLTPGNPGNSGGKKGRSGRPPDEFKEHMKALASDKKVDAYLRKCLAGEFGPRFFLQALTYASDRGYGKPTQPLEHSGEIGGGVLRVPTPVTAEEWSAVASEQQAQLAAKRG